MLSNHRFDKAALDRYLRARLPDFDGLQAVRQFQGGQSNPTFLLETPAHRYVLRKRPPGRLLATAHAVDREHRVMHALADSDVPVPRMLVYVDDESVIGTAFFVMDYVPGRVFTHPALVDAAPGERRHVFEAMAATLGRLHRIDPATIGLADFGKPTAFLARQIARWTRQYEASTVPDADMARLVPWLEARIPAGDATGAERAIAHGDFRVGNLIYDPEQPLVRAVLDWELATIGHPLADLAYSCLPFRVPSSLNGVADVSDPTLPREADVLATYCQTVGRTLPPDFEFYVAFSLFRWAAILAGVYRRALDGNAADARAFETGERFHAIAHVGWETARAASR